MADPTMNNQIIGYVAAATTLAAFGTQFVHTVRSGTVEGVSLTRSVFDSISLALWALYATRIDDNPLLIATGCELFLSLCVCSLILKHHLNRPLSLKIENTENVQINMAGHKMLPLSYVSEMPQMRSCE
jgi:uncharacterized protein with PQ loop repeat